jgi:hypothetical protein
MSPEVQPVQLPSFRQANDTAEFALPAFALWSAVSDRPIFATLKRLPAARKVIFAYRISAVCYGFLSLSIHMQLARWISKVLRAIFL